MPFSNEVAILIIKKWASSTLFSIWSMHTIPDMFWKIFGSVFKISSSSYPFMFLSNFACHGLRLNESWWWFIKWFYTKKSTNCFGSVYVRTSLHQVKLVRLNSIFHQSSYPFLSSSSRSSIWNHCITPLRLCIQHGWWNAHTKKFGNWQEQKIKRINKK